MGVAPFELKSASLTALALLLKSADLALLTTAMNEQFGATPGLFDHDPVVIDLASLPSDAPPLDFAALMGLLTQHRLRPVAVRGGSAEQRAAALTAGLGDAPEATPTPASVKRRGPAAPEAPAAGALPEPIPTPPAPAAAAEPTVTSTDSAPAPKAVRPATAHTPTLTVYKPLRSGQQVYAKGGDLIVLAAVNAGAEVLADGNIHVYGPLRGKAVAGAKGQADARIFSTCMEPELIAIAGTYRTTENPLPADVLGKPAQIRLEGDRLVFEPLI